MRHLWVGIACLVVAACGAKAPSESVTQQSAPILDGVDAPEATNIVAVRVNTATGTIMCSGALIAPSLVVVERRPDTNNNPSY
jgi:hypothetical protein